MLLNKRQMGRIFSIVAALGCLALPLWAKGYLTVIGPAPIRVQEPPVSAPAALVLPPLPSAQPPKADSPEIESQRLPNYDEPPMALATPAVFEPIIVQAGGDTNFVSSILGALGAAPEQDWLTPQMLVPYYREISSTNGIGKVVVLPPTFVPPAPVSRPSSKAVYTVPAR